MFPAAAVAVAWILCTVAQLHSGPVSVTHDRTRLPDVCVSASLTPLSADRRLQFPGGDVYRPRPRRSSPAAVVVSMLLLLGGVESNPGPPVTGSPPHAPSARRHDALQFGLLNARSARRKAALIHDVVHDNHLDVLCLTETWIPSDAPNAVKLDVAPPGYAVVHRHRGTSSDRGGGGVALVHRQSIKATPVDVGDHSEFECLAVKLVGRQARAVTVVCVYRPPGPVSSPFVEQLCRLLDQLTLLDTPFVVVGDFNAPGSAHSPGDDHAGLINDHVADVFAQYCLRQHVNVATHVGGNVLDLIASPECGAGSQLIASLAVQSVCFSDHHLVTCRLGVPPPPPISTTYSYRPLRSMDMAAFRHDMLQSKLFDDSVTDADQYAELFDGEVQRVLDIHAPLRTRRRRCGQHDSRQLSDEARRAKQLRRRCERRYRRTGQPADKQAYQSACSAARVSIQKSRADRIKAELAEVSGDVGATWRTAQRLLHNDHKVVYDDAECATLVSTFSRFFVDKVNRIRDNIAAALRSSPHHVFVDRPHTGPALTAFIPVTVDEVRRLLSTMPSKSSPLDTLPYSLLTGCADVFAPAIARLANLSLQTGVFPSCYKRAQVLPLLKKAGLDTSAPSNYRPISNLSTLSKVLERLVLARLRPHLLDSTNFSQYQSAYRQGHSTETALLEVLDNVYATADDKEVTVLIGLDLSAAFDTVDHDTLLQRLQIEFGVTGTALCWLRSYLERRSQFVKLSNHQSPAVSLDIGVPQGSVLGPLLFAVYCSPVGDIIQRHGVRYHQYADDTQLHLAMHADNTVASLSVLAACTADVRLWYLQNGLQLNADKSEALVVGTSCQLKQASSAFSSVTVAGVDLPVAEQMKVLGVTLDRRLTFDQHATAVVRSCNYHLQAIRHNRHLLTPELTKTLTCSLILSRLDYCNAVLHGAPNGTTKKLQRVQNNAARLIQQAPRRCDAKPLLRSLHWLPVEHRTTYKLAVITYKTQHTGTPAYLNRHLQPHHSTRQTRSSDIPLLVQPFSRTNFVKRSFRHSAPAVWNSLPRTVLDSTSLTVFKSRLKTHLFHLAYNS